MTLELSANTEAILLLTAPLILDRRSESVKLLTPGEYKRLAHHLLKIRHQPSDLLLPQADDLLQACQPVIDHNRLKKLLERGLLLAQAINHWQTRAIWVVSRADAQYPRRLKTRLREDAPAILYGCGNRDCLSEGGLAVVGSRHVDEALIDYTMSIGRLAASAGKTIISGGAKGIDQAAMKGALDNGGKVCGVLADGLEKACMSRENRDALMKGDLVLISPYDPNAGFNVGNAMQRNKLIYAFSDAALVVSSDFNKGGTWAGAVEQLDKLNFVPVFTRSSGELSPGLEALSRKGACPWPDPQDADGLNALLSASGFGQKPPLQASLFSDDEPQPKALAVSDNASFKDHAISPLTESHDIVTSSPTASQVAENNARSDDSPAQALFAVVRTMIVDSLKRSNHPISETEIANMLAVSLPQAKSWLEQLVKEDTLEKLSRPVRYTLKKA